MAKTTFTDRNPSTGAAGTIITAALMNALNNHHHTGLAEDGAGALPYASDSGAADAYAVALNPVLTQYITGMPVWFKAANANTGAATLNINSLGAVSIKKSGNKDLLAGDIAAGLVVGVVYDGTNFQLLTRALSEDKRPGDIILSTIADAPAGALKINGATLSRAAYAALFANAVPQMAVAVSIASPAVFTTASAHGLAVGDRVRLATTGTLPTGLAVNTDYYIVSCPSGETFTLSATPGGAEIDTSGSQSGTHTLSVWRGYGPGDGSSTFTLPAARGYAFRIYDEGAGVDSGRTLGSLQEDAFQGHKWDVSGDTLYVKQFTMEGSGTDVFVHDGTGGKAYVDSLLSDGANGTPRTAAETRMKNFAIAAFIKY